MVSLQLIGGDFKSSVSEVIKLITKMHNTLPVLYDRIQHGIDSLTTHNMRDVVDIFETQNELNSEYRLTAQVLSGSINELSQLLTRDVRRFSSLKFAIESSAKIKRDAVDVYLNFVQVYNKMARDLKDLHKSLERRVHYTVPVDFSSVKLEYKPPIKAEYQHQLQHQLKAEHETSVVKPEPQLLLQQQQHHEYKLETEPEQVYSLVSEHDPGYQLEQSYKLGTEPEMGHSHDFRLDLEARVLQSINDQLYDLSQRVQDMIVATKVDPKDTFDENARRMKEVLDLLESKAAAPTTEITWNKKVNNEMSKLVADAVQSNIENYLTEYMEPLMRRVIAQIDTTFQRTMEAFRYDQSEEQDRRYRFLVTQNAEIATLLENLNVDGLREIMNDAVQRYGALFTRAFDELERVLPSLVETLGYLRQIISSENGNHHDTIVRLREMTRIMGALRNSIEGETAQPDVLLERVAELERLLASTESNLASQQYSLGEIASESNPLDWAM